MRTDARGGIMRRRGCNCTYPALQRARNYWRFAREESFEGGHSSGVAQQKDHTWDWPNPLSECSGALERTP
jgi:hypothetical protein